MPIPDYETLMLPILQYLGDKTTRKTREIVAHIIKVFDITPEEAKTFIPSGRAKLISNRVGWACTYLRKAELISSPQRGLNVITDKGVEVLSHTPERIDNKYLAQYDEFRDFQSMKPEEETTAVIGTDESSGKTPEEIMGLQEQKINAALRKELLSTVSELEPDVFEQLVVDLLVAMGYGGTVEDAGQAIGQSNDGGIDGIIKEDVLGLDTIYIQAKRWQNTVPVKEVRDFAGALLSKRSNKGVFITTSSFPQSAHDFVSSIDRKIILIDGNTMANYMITYNLGVSVRNTIEIKEIDSDYFA